MVKCPCITLKGIPGSRDTMNNYPFCGSHLNQLIWGFHSRSAFKRSRVLRTSFREVEDILINEALEKWTNENEDVMRWTDPERNPEIILKILSVRGRMTIQALTEAFNSHVQAKYSATLVGRALTPMVKAGQVLRTTTRSQGMTIHKTTAYELSKKEFELG